MPDVNAVTFQTVRDALRAGIDDFLRAPLFGLFFGGIFTAGGLFILVSLIYLKMPWMIIPVAIGFPLIGPFVAVGLYEVSRRLSAGEPLVWKEVLLVMFRQRERQLSWMAFVVLFIFWMWIYQVRLLLALFLGFKSMSTIPRFVEIVTTTQEGMLFVGVGTLSGAVLSIFLFSATVISMPLLLDRELDFVSAMIISFKTVLKSPAPMIGWGVLVVALAIIGMIPAFLGMIIILPILGHTTWHLYVAAIGPEKQTA
ncbi:MAG: DUF2189 domain-containing protein [Hyphomicrobiales bacterium]|nr:DUF2189 domain-containing protein [Hyphomicrobiales bacterium]MCP4998087.1 DUF2189 domain-containing protein [Hyphomicrobiales bacterium]